jgi:hypothetical protein
MSVHGIYWQYLNLFLKYNFNLALMYSCSIASRILTIWVFVLITCKIVSLLIVSYSVFFIFLLHSSLKTLFFISFLCNIFYYLYIGWCLSSSILYLPLLYLPASVRDKFFYYYLPTHLHLLPHHHHQPINVPTAGAQAFLMDYLQGESFT